MICEMKFVNNFQNIQLYNLYFAYETHPLVFCIISNMLFFSVNFLKLSIYVSRQLLTVYLKISSLILNFA
jgi:hypothetical protein